MTPGGQQWVTVMAELTEDGSNRSREIGGIELAGAKHTRMPYQESKIELHSEHPVNAESVDDPGRSAVRCGGGEAEGGDGGDGGVDDGNGADGARDVGNDA
jgi:hypothetical protein